MSIHDNLIKVQDDIARTAIEAGRTPSHVKLLGVTKKQPIDAIEEAYRAGLFDFGENYLQEAKPKVKALAHADINWHFIGPLQSNKAKDIARMFSWVHSVDRIKIASLLHAERQDQQGPLNICIQVNMDNEPSKSGVLVESLDELVEAILPLDSLRLRGLMAMPKIQKHANLQIQSFDRLKNLLISINNRYNLNLDTLSMGTSQDYHSAILSGSTIIRVGQAIFGKRQ